MSFTSNLRDEKKKELTKLLTDMLEDSRTALKEEISKELEGTSTSEEAKAKINDIMDTDIDEKLKLIPGIVKMLLDEADEKAQKEFIERWGNGLFPSQG